MVLWEQLQVVLWRALKRAEMVKREILPYLKTNVVVFALSFYKRPFQLYHKSSKKATVLWKKR